MYLNSHFEKNSFLDLVHFSVLIFFLFIDTRRFDGDGMLHAVEFKDGKAYYQNTYIKTDKWITENKKGKVLYPGTNRFLFF